MARPVIGVSALIDIPRESLWMVPGYMDGIEEAGALPIMLPLTEDAEVVRQAAALCDGFLFTGGQDVSPQLYGADRLPACGETSALRDHVESILLQEARRSDRPVLGICRGIQFINAALGGTLWQDLPSERPSDIEHHMSPPYDRAAHRDRIIEGSPLEQLMDGLLENGYLSVNSYHHQAVKALAPGLEVMAVSEDGLIEALRDPSQHFLWAVQWHPEFSYKTDESARRIFRAFVEACV